MRWALKSRLLTAVAVLWALGTASCRKPESKTSPHGIPSSWNLDEIARETPPYGYEGMKGVYVLAWAIREDDRPLKVEECVVMRVLEEDDGQGRWCLAHLWRQPDSRNAKWKLSTIHVSGAEGTKYWPGMWIHHAVRFKTRPTNKELYASLADGLEGVRWSFELDPGWRYIDCGVCEQNWQTVTGEKPTQGFKR